MNHNMRQDDRIPWRDLFEKFWNRKRMTLSMPNPERFHQNMLKLLDKCETVRDAAVIDHYVCALQQGKESARRTVVQFYHYLEEEGIPVQSDLFDRRLFDYPFERQLEIAKYLYEPRSTREVYTEDVKGTPAYVYVYNCSVEGMTAIPYDRQPYGV